MSTVLHVGERPSVFESDAIFFDAQHPVPRAVRVRVDDARGVLMIADAAGMDWPLDAIRELPDQAGDDLLVLRLAKDEEPRLILPDRTLRPHLPNLHKRPEVKGVARIFGWAAGAILSVALIVFVLVPVLADSLAAFIPPEGERALGEATLEHIRTALDETGFQSVDQCSAPDGVRALEKMEARLQSTLDMPIDLSVMVLEHDMINAFALPGGFVVLFSGLIDMAETPEELAAVFAHEIGHVVSRDPVRHALRSAGSIGVVGLLFGDFAGGAFLLFLTERLIDARYSQDAEAKADLFAHETMIKAGLPPNALARMFERLRAETGEINGVVSHFLAHPQLGDRIAAAQKATPDNFRAAPLLSDLEWRALKAICD